MKKILGLDLGSSSVGWAVVNLEDKQQCIVDLGSRIIPLTKDDSDQFAKGQAISKNAERTTMRTIRKSYDRRQQRKKNLTLMLDKLGMHPANVSEAVELWRLRSVAVSGQLSLPELGRVLYHLNQKRGYRSGKEDFNDSSKSKYVQSVNGNYSMLKDAGLTIGQYYFNKLSEDPSSRIKDNVFPRIAYLEEFDKIAACQQKYYPNVLTDKIIKTIRNEIIFYQRPLKSCKHLVSICEFEKNEYQKADGSSIVTGPHVAPDSSPLSQLCKVWEFVNTIRITNRSGEEYTLSLDEKKSVAEYLRTHEKIGKLSNLKGLIGIDFTKKNSWKVEKTVGERKVGDMTYVRIAKALDGKYDSLLQFDLRIDLLSDESTGEVTNRVISEDFKREPLFRLWHTLYSIQDIDTARKVVSEKFGIDDEDVVTNLCMIDFVKDGYAGKSSTAMRKILPHLMEGYVYSDACAAAGYNHSGYVTKEENESRELADRITPLEKGDLRQPVVEKILNQTINVVNALNEKYGPFDEIRVELARELKQSREERARTTSSISKNEKTNAALSGKIVEYGITPTKSRIIKMKLWEETEHTCMYCGQPVNVKEFLAGIDVEREHIIPRSLYFDNGMSNVTCSCRKCNQEKGNQTAFDFMKARGEEAFQAYLERANKYFNGEDAAHKNNAKFRNLLTSKNDIPQDFIDRQLRESQYISREAMRLMREICRNVYATSGSVTDFLRHTWGWDTVLHDLHFTQYKELGLTELKEVQSPAGPRQVEVISNWSKRLDHRHHAIDALVIACTSNRVVQQLNHLSTLKDVPFKPLEKQGNDYKIKHSLLESYVLAQPHFTTEEVKEASKRIFVSFKSGKKVVTPGKRYSYTGGKRILQQTVLVPRGPLSEQTVYGKINADGESQYVVKYPVSNIKVKDIESIVDCSIKEIVRKYFELHNGKYIETDPILDYQGKIIRSVRMFTGLKKVAAVKYDESGIPIGFVKPGSNHHIAVYQDEKGKYVEQVVTFWSAVERRKYGIPIIVTDPAGTFDALSPEVSDEVIAKLPDPKLKYIMSMQQNEMFVMGMSDDEFADAVRTDDKSKISDHLFRVQSISEKDYFFRHHLETSVDDKYAGDKNMKLSVSLNKLIRIKSINAFFQYHPRKVRINMLGEIVND